MTLARPTFGTVKGEEPAVLHRLGTLAGRSYCGKTIVAGADNNRAGLVQCQRCKTLEEARRSGIPDWFTLPID